MRFALPALLPLCFATLFWTTYALGQCGPQGTACLIGTTGDLDLDGDVDEADWPLMGNCLNGPDLLVSSGCEFGDAESDGDFDLLDLSIIQQVFTGPCSCPPNLLPPTARFSVSPFLGVAPLTVDFDAGRTTDSEAILSSYHWDFGDGAQGSGRQTTHTFTQAGTYLATLTATDAGGLANQTTVVITISDGSYDLNAPVTANEARRFLWQAAFGPDPNAVDFIMQNGYEAWIDAQRTVPVNRILWADQQANDNNYDDGWEQPHEIWDDLCVQGEDQLRQRMAWALIQIIVINSSQAMTDNEGAGYYYSEYIDRALGNYHDLLEFVTFSHQMGIFLTYINNTKADPSTGTQPDENYARELMQLFTIGLWELNSDGTRMLDTAGNPIPTYGNDEVRQFARIMTGFRWAWDLPEGDNWGVYPMPMQANRHEFGAKQLLDYPGAIPLNGFIPAWPTNQWLEDIAIAEIELALENVFRHPNVAPFVSKQLIQHLVTSNPTPAYVARVAEAFEGNGPYGSGVRGDLFATTKAILLDNEARDPAYRSNPAYGRLIDPLIVRWGLYRVLGRVDRPTEPFPFQIASGPWNGMSDFGQQLMQSPSVFNFYPPDYVPPGTAMVSPGYFAPELRIHNDVTALSMMNALRGEIIIPENEREAARYAAWRPLASDPAALVEALNQEMLYGTLTDEARTIIETTVGVISDDTYRVRTAVWLIAGSPEFRVLK